MLIHDPPKPTSRKELKVHLPARQLRALRRLRGETGVDNAAVVTQALALYFSRVAAEDATARAWS